MSGGRVRWLAWTLCGLAICLAVAAFWYGSLNQGGSRSLLQIVEAALTLLAVTVAAIVAALIVSRQPRNTIGWLLMTPVCLFLLALPILEYLNRLAPSAPEPSLPLALLIWFNGWSWILLIFPIILIPLLFPDGQPPTPRWRMVVLASIVWAGIFVLIASLWQPIRVDTTPEIIMDNPIGVLGDAYQPLIDAWVVGLMLLTIASVAALAVRYRLADATVRKQIRWLLFAGAIFLVVYVGGWATGVAGDDASEAWNALFSLSLVGFPVAIGIAILRHRLFDIDLIINRTLVYGTLTAIVAGIYSAAVSLFVNVFRDTFSQSSLLAIVLVTLVVTAAFTPVKGRLQQLVDRVVPAERDPAKELKPFRLQVEMLRHVVNAEQVNGRGLLSRLLAEAAEAYGADGGGIYLGQGDGRQLIDSTADWEGEVGLCAPIEHGGQEIGLVVLGHRSNRTPYSRQDERVLRETIDVVSPLISPRIARTDGTSPVPSPTRSQES